MNITLHLPTAAITVAIGSLALFGMSASAPQSPPPDRDVQAVEDIGRPKPEDLVWIYCTSQQPVTFTVPLGRAFVLNGRQSTSSYTQILIDGVTSRNLFSDLSFGSGIPFSEGQTITVFPNTDQHSLFGYLVDA